VRLNREQMICVGALALLLLACALAVGSSLQARSDAVHELAERRDALTHLLARARSGTEARRRTVTTAPAAAFLDASTSGLAAAQLQAYLSQVAANQSAILISYGVDQSHREDSPDSLRVQANLDVSQKAIQGLLYQLESQTPYVFVDAMSVQPVGTAALGAAQDATLRITLSLRAFWRRGVR
jgi:hypothetical protein